MKDDSRGFLGCDAVWSCMWLRTFRRNVSSQCRRLRSISSTQNCYELVVIHLVLSPLWSDCIKVIIQRKLRWMRHVASMEILWIHTFFGKYQRKSNLRDLGIDGRIMSKLSSRNRVRMCGVDSSGSVGISCESSTLGGIIYERITWFCFLVAPIVQKLDSVFLFNCLLQPRQTPNWLAHNMRLALPLS